MGQKRAWYLGEYHQELSLPRRYVLAVGIFLIALLTRFIVLPVEAGLAFLTFYPALVLSFYLCGTIPGLLTAFLGAVAGYYFFTPPFWTFSPSSTGLVGVCFFLFSSGLIGFIVHKLHLAIGRAQQSEQRYLGILEDQTEVIARFKADGTVLYVNDAFCRFFGMSRDHVVGRDWQPFPVPEDIPMIERALATIAPDNPVVTIENRVMAAQGQMRWAQFNNRGFFNARGELVEIQSVGRDITTRKELEAKLAESSRLIEDLYDHAPCGYHSIGPDGCILHINATELGWLGCTRDEVVGRRKITDFFTPAGRESFQKHYSDFLAEGHIENLEFELIGLNGQVRQVLVSATAVKDECGKFIMSRSVMYDVTEIKALGAELNRVLHEQGAMLDNDLVGIVKLRERNIVWKNKAMSRIFGFAPGELIGAPTRLLYPDDESYRILGEEAYPILKASGTYRTQREMIRKGGERIWVDISGVLLPGDGSESLWMLADITELKHQQEQIDHLAHHDVLTGLPNRLLLSDRLEQAVAQAERSERLLAVCYLDLDGFKLVNDRFGHEAGDKLLQEVARRMKSCVRTHDTVCRIGGDEFVLMLTNLENVEEYEVVLQRIIEAINNPFFVGDGQMASVTASIGITLSPLDSSDADVLLRHADHAMYRAKRAGRHRICLYSPETD